MADDKKPKGDKPKEEKKVASTDPFAEVLWVILAILLFVYALNSFFSFLGRTNFLTQGFGIFTEKGALTLRTKPISSISNPIGGKFIAVKNKIAIYDSPGGKKVGEKKLGDSGKIIGGPVNVGGERYWRVLFDDGLDGWVIEEDIAVLIESEESVYSKIIKRFWGLVFYAKYFVLAISFLLVLFIAFMLRNITRLSTERRKKLYPGISDESFAISEAMSQKNHRWEKIITHIESENENDWRHAIVEADIILAELLDTMSLPGETVGDKLKAIEKSDFLTLDSAWEAHKIRNQIAHEGSGFMLNQKEAKRVIDLYRSVFEEFHLI